MKKRNKSQFDWSSKRFKQTLVETRKFIWHDDTLITIATWLGLRPGMSIVDVGCGLGYLGYTFGRFYTKGGRYIGLDINTNLLKDAKKAAMNWTKGRIPFFVTGDAYNLPFNDNCIDCVMCQTLFIQVKNPKPVLSEMVRIVKPGGTVVCIEPDNLSWRTFSSIPAFTIKEEAFQKKFDLIWNKGRTRLGYGDYTIGCKIPHLMKEAGLANIDARINDKVDILEPPYDTPSQRYRLKMLRKHVTDDKKERQFWLRLAKKFYLAGGGNANDIKRLIKITKRRRKILKEQIQNHIYFSCTGGCIYVVKGIKKKSVKKK